MSRSDRDRTWAAAHVEREALADDLATLTDEQWSTRSLCTGWSVEDVVAHLTASASIGPLAWMRSTIGARWDFDLHNRRRLAEHRGSTPRETLERFRRIVGSTTAAPGPAVAWLGEVVVHSADIRRPLGLTRAVPGETLEAVAMLFAARSYAVPTRARARGLRLEATDGPFVAGSSSSPVVRGGTLALVMALAGREAFCDELAGDGVGALRARCAAPAR